MCAFLTSERMYCAFVRLFIGPAAGPTHAISPSMKTLTVGNFMTRSPQTIGADQTLAAAHEMMRRHKIRHLPVLKRSKLVGVVSQRDLQFIEGLPNVDPNSVCVEDAMSEKPCAVSPSTSLDWVASEMASHKYGCMIVLEAGKVVGVFTTVDAMRALAQVLGRSQRQARTTRPRNERRAS